MKALTICQPYAELIARGEKLIENRAWSTPYRGLLAIHAGKSREWLDHDDLTEYPDMVFGAVIAIATLADCIHLRGVPNELPEAWVYDPRYADHANGPWCWVLADVRRIRPMPCNGSQGLWESPLSPGAVDPVGGIGTDGPRA